MKRTGIALPSRSLRATTAALCTLVALAAIVSCARGPEQPFVLGYIGHDAFRFNTGKGTIIVCDLYRPETAENFSLPRIPVGLKADVLLVSHNHIDHNYVGCIAGKPEVIRAPGTYAFDGMRLTVYQGKHGLPGSVDTGLKSGPNLISVYERDGCKVVHLADSGIIVDPVVLAGISDADVVIANVGNSVFPQEKIMAFMASIRARTVVAAHWDGLDQLERFIENDSGGVPVVRGGGEIALRPGMPTQLLVMRPLVLDMKAP